MTALTITIPDDEASRLRELAEEHGISPEGLAADAVRERIERARTEDSFETVAKRVVEKNEELYRRLA